MTTTATFIDYACESFRGGVFSIDTGGNTAVLTLSLNHPEFAVSYEFTRTVGRELGTSLLRWSGSPLCCTIDPVEFATIPVTDYTAAVYGGPALRVEVMDGTVMFALRDGQFQVGDQELINLAQRLIVWAGVDTKAAIDA